jgi:hypothetical protein
MPLAVDDAKLRASGFGHERQLYRFSRLTGSMLRRASPPEASRDSKGADKLSGSGGIAGFGGIAEFGGIAGNTPTVPAGLAFRVASGPLAVSI